MLTIVLIRGRGLEVTVGERDLAACDVTPHAADGELARDDPGIPDGYVRIVPIGDRRTVVGMSRS